MYCKFNLLYALSLGLAFVGTVAHALTVDVEPNETECFFEDLKIGNTLSISYEVGFGGQQKIDFSLMDSTGRVVQVSAQQNAGFYTATADRDGQYTYCFNNHMNDGQLKTVSFYIHEDHHNKEDEPLQEEIRTLTRNVQEIREHQEYIIQRERAHRNTAESTNDRVKWWSVAETVIVLGVAFFQVNYLKRFFEVKRVV
ncbi:emp24/gp25L/p24 family/GOLD-domain-containing protein [Syncephalis fuscata]|nr:emp24/gp25L/p24 family/GOLD-domain-containing protein [Syncephalis fuscata]